MDHTVHYMAQLRMPAMTSNQTGDITFKNNSSRQNKLLQKKRNLLSMLSPEERRKYLSLCIHRGTEIFTLCHGILKEQGFAVVSEGLCRWYFPDSLRRNLMLRTEELSARGITAVFSQSEKAVLDSDITKFSDAFSKAAICMITSCYPDHNISLKSLVSFTRISSHLLLKTDRILLPNDRSAFILDSPEDAYRAMGECLAILTDDTSAPAELILKDRQIFFVAGDKCLDAGSVHIDQTVCAIAPYNYGKSDAASAITASCAAELLLFYK